MGFPVTQQVGLNSIQVQEDEKVQQTQGEFCANTIANKSRVVKPI